MSKSLTLHHLRPAIAKATGQPEAASIAELWEQIDSLKPQPETIPPSIEDRLDHIIALLQSAPAPTPSPKPDAIPPVNYDGVLWGYGNRWVPAEWGVPNGPIPYKADHVQGQPDGSVRMVADAKGSADFRAGQQTPGHTTGLWEADVTLPKMKEGVVVAPLWIYDGTNQEVDIEFAGKTGLQLNLHADNQQAPVRPFGDEDWSERRVTFGIKVEADRVSIIIDGKEAHAWEKASMAFFVDKPLSPFFEMWPVNSPSGWTDDFTGYADGEQLVMTVNGFRYTAL